MAPLAQNAATRRSFLAALSGTAAAAVAPAVALSAPATVTESPELLALGEQIELRLQALREARARLAEAEAMAQRLAPAVPAALIHDRAKGDRYFGQFTYTERDVFDREYGYGGGHQLPRKLYCSRLMRSEIIIHDIGPDTAQGRKLRRLIRIARRYERDMEQARTRSAYQECDTAAFQCGSELEGAMRAIAEAPAPKTMEGVRVVARAIVASSGSEGDTAGALLGLPLAEAILKIAGGTVEAAVQS